jgi:hypothetical protein
MTLDGLFEPLGAWHNGGARNWREWQTPYRRLPDLLLHITPLPTGPASQISRPT